MLQRITCVGHHRLYRLVQVPEDNRTRGEPTLSENSRGPRGRDGHFVWQDCQTKALGTREEELVALEAFHQQPKVGAEVVLMEEAPEALEKEAPNA